MREILFRGKYQRTKDTYGWIYGDLVHDDDGVRIYQNPHREILYKALVDPATVGQYTGLKDKNSVEIFEGDIVRIASKDFPTSIFKIVWESRVAQFEVENENINLSFSVFVFDEIEVIGNIYDNSELLEGKNNETD